MKTWQAPLSTPPIRQLFSRLLLMLGFVLVTGCVKYRTLDVDPKYLNWSPYCFKGFVKKATELAAAQHQNCGFFSVTDPRFGSDWFYHNLSNGLSCVDEAYKNQEAFIYGIHTIWRDTYVCEAYIGAEDGQIYRLFLDFDPTGGFDTSGKEAWYIEEVCDAITINEKIRVSHYMNHITDSGCRRLGE